MKLDHLNKKSSHISALAWKSSRRLLSYGDIIASRYWRTWRS
jgi:hypothetical protein